MDNNERINYESYELILKHTIVDNNNGKNFNLEEPIVVKIVQPVGVVDNKMVIINQLLYKMKEYVENDI